MRLTEPDQLDFQNATTCHICEKPVLANEVRDHCHMTPGFNFRRAAHNSCNLNYKKLSFMPVIFHNLRGYDSHLKLSKVDQLHPRKISCIPNNKEKYITFSIGFLRFIDSLQFLSCNFLYVLEFALNYYWKNKELSILMWVELPYSRPMNL